MYMVEGRCMYILAKQALHALLCAVCTESGGYYRLLVMLHGATVCSSCN